MVTAFNTDGWAIMRCQQDSVFKQFFIINFQIIFIV